MWGLAKYRVPYMEVHVACFKTNAFVALLDSAIKRLHYKIEKPLHLYFYTLGEMLTGHCSNYDFTLTHSLR